MRYSTRSHSEGPRLGRVSQEIPNVDVDEWVPLRGPWGDRGIHMWFTSG